MRLLLNIAYSSRPIGEVTGLSYAEAGDLVALEVIDRLRKALVDRVASADRSAALADVGRIATADLGIDKRADSDARMQDAGEQLLDPVRSVIAEVRKRVRTATVLVESIDPGNNAESGNNLKISRMLVELQGVVDLLPGLWKADIETPVRRRLATMEQLFEQVNDVERQSAKSATELSASESNWRQTWERAQQVLSSDLPPQFGEAFGALPSEVRSAAIDVNRALEAVEAAKSLPAAAHPLLRLPREELALPINDEKLRSERTPMGVLSDERTPVKIAMEKAAAFCAEEWSLVSRVQPSADAFASGSVSYLTSIQQTLDGLERKLDQIDQEIDEASRAIADNNVLLGAYLTSLASVVKYETSLSSALSESKEVMERAEEPLQQFVLSVREARITEGTRRNSLAAARRLTGEHVSRLFQTNDPALGQSINVSAFNNADNATRSVVRGAVEQQYMLGARLGPSAVEAAIEGRSYAASDETVARHVQVATNAIEQAARLAPTVVTGLRPPGHEQTTGIAG